MINWFIDILRQFFLDFQNDKFRVNSWNYRWHSVWEMDAPEVFVFSVPCIITTLIINERERLVAALSGLYGLQVVRLPVLSTARNTDRLKTSHLGLWLSMKRIVNSCQETNWTAEVPPSRTVKSLSLALAREQIKSRSLTHWSWIQSPRWFEYLKPREISCSSGATKWDEEF